MLSFKREDVLPGIFQNGENANENIAQIAVLTIKALIPSENEVGNRIDYRRFYEELKLWKYYRRGENQSLLNILGEIDEDVYFKSKDDTLYSRIVPIVLANVDFDIIEDELIRNIIYSNGNIEVLLEWLLIGKTIYLLIEGQENILDILKGYAIGISQRKLLENYRDMFRVDIDRYPGNYVVEFERKRIGIINILNEIHIDGYDMLKDILGVLKGDTWNSVFGNIIYNCINNGNVDYKLDNFHRNMSEYVLRLRRGRIDPKDLKIEEYILPDIFNFKEGEMFFHSLLKNSKIIKKEIRDNTLVSLVGTKTGIYEFKKEII